YRTSSRRSGTVSLGETGGAPRAFVWPLGSGGRRSGCFGKNHRCRYCYHRRRAACYRSYPFSTTANNASEARIATESSSSWARMKRVVELTGFEPVRSWQERYNGSASKLDGMP